MKSSTTAVQLSLPFAPAAIRDHGLRAVHPRPLVGKRTPKGIRSWRTSPDRAWIHELIQIENAGSSYASITLDCDHLGGLWNLHDLPPFNWAVQSPSGGKHVSWAFASPVHRFPAARRAPLDYAARVSEYYANAVRADPGYSHTLTYNPCAENAKTDWGRLEPYTLDELATVIPAHWRRPQVSQTGLGRNCDLFRSLLRYAGRLANAKADLLTEALRINAAFPAGLGLTEVAATVRSVDGYRERWARRGWHDPRWLARQAARGRASGRSRREGSNELLRPWELEGVHRATWYRRQAAKRGTGSHTGNNPPDATRSHTGTALEPTQVMRRMRLEPTQISTLQGCPLPKKPKVSEAVEGMGAPTDPRFVENPVENSRITCWQTVDTPSPVRPTERWNDGIHALPRI